MSSASEDLLVVRPGQPVCGHVHCVVPGCGQTFGKLTRKTLVD